MHNTILCSIRDAARTLGIGRTKIYAMIAERQLETVQIGTRRLVKMDSIRALIERATGGVQ